MDNSINEKLWSLPVAASRVGVSYWRLRRLALDGHVPYIQFPDSAVIYFRPDDLKTCIEKWVVNKK